MTLASSRGTSSAAHVSPTVRRTVSRVILTALVACAHVPAAAQERPPAVPASISLGDAFALQRQRHEALAAADALVEQRRLEQAAAHTLYYPRVEAHTRLTRIDAPIEIDLDPIRQVILSLHPQVPPSRVPAFTTTVQDATFWKADVRATWPFFTGGRVPAANAAAAARTEEARADRRQTAGALATDLVRRYYAVQLAKAARGVRTAVVEGLRAHAYNARRLQEEGLAARVERLGAEVALAEAERQLRRAADDEALARIALAGALSLDEPPEPVTPLFVLDDLEAVETFVAAMRASHPVLAKLSAQTAQAAQAVRAERGRRWPDLFAFGTRELYENDLTILEPSWAAGIGANWLLFDGGERARKAAAARAQVDRVTALDARARRDLATQTEAKHRDVRRARDQFVTLEATLGLAEEHLRVRTRAFEEGLATSLEVVDARLALSRVQLERLLAAYEYDVALAELLEATGQSDRYEDFRGRPTRRDVN